MGQNFLDRQYNVLWNMTHTEAKFCQIVYLLYKKMTWLDGHAVWNMIHTAAIRIITKDLYMRKKSNCYLRFFRLRFENMSDQAICNLFNPY